MTFRFAAWRGLTSGLWRERATCSRYRGTAMAEPELIAAVRAADCEAVAAALAAGANPDQQDEQGWTALCFAAGMGDEDVAKCLLDHGADVFRTGHDQRTPYLIALAARRLNVARLLSDAEE